MRRCVIDTNVLITANKALKNDPDDDVYDYPALITGCIKMLMKIIEKGIYVVLDIDDKIFSEYKRHLNFSGEPGLGDMFFQWLHDHRYSFPDSERVKLHKTKEGYLEFPAEMLNVNVDPSDMMFFAVSNAHPRKPDIIEATDTKWRNWVDSAKQCGINIEFIDEEYIRNH